MSDDCQTAASLRPIRRKRADNHMPAGTHRISYAFGVGRAVSWISQKMERGPIMPNIVAFIRAPSRHIRNNPCDVLSPRTKPLPRCSQGFFRDIEHTERTKAFCDQGIDQTRCTASNINDWAPQAPLPSLE